MNSPDRWFDTPATYSRDEARSIKRQVAERRPKVMCPRCNTQLMFGTPITQRDKVIWQVRCPDCNRSVIIRETSEEGETPS
jgi:transcription elongation factor Elf1